MQDVVVIIMGAAVLTDGKPSGAMLRRITGALSLRNEFKNLIYVPSGGIGKSGYSEAETMKILLKESGIDEKNIVPEPASENTLQSVINCRNIINALPKSDVIVCSDTYHIFRSRFLLMLLGVSTIYRNMPSGKQVNGSIRWTYYYAREILALPKDIILLVVKQFLNKL